MRNKVYWTLGVLMILLIAVTTVVVVRNNNEARILQDELEEKLEAQKKAENTPEVVEISNEKPLSDPPEPIEPPPVEEKPPVAEVSNGTGNRLQYLNAKPIDMMTDEEFREWHRGGRSLEEYEAKKEVELRFFPEQIEHLERAVASYEARIKRWEEHFQRNPNSTGGNGMYEEDKRQLGFKRPQLNALKRVMEVIYGIK